MRLEPLTPPTTQTPSYFPPPARVAWPDAVAYREAVQTPTVSLGEPGWKTATVATNKLGLPITYAGRFAVVFKANLASGETWALRCFTSPGADSGLNGQGVGRAMRYRLLVPHAARLPHLFVPFRYVDSGIKVGGQWYPVVAMQWASGTPLGQWVEKNLHQPEKLRRLCGVLSGVLAELEAAQMAHGDWQHDNLLVSATGDSVTLVDYDGLYVPELAGSPSPENGHPNYQHPARTSEYFGPGLDRFACLTLQTGLLALSHQPDLWTRFSDGESVVFQKADFIDPARSPAFHAVRAIAQETGDETLADSIARLEDACTSGAGETMLPGIAPVELPRPPVPPFSVNFDLSAAAPQQTTIPQTKNGKSAATLWWENQAASGGNGAKNGAKWWQANNQSANQAAFASVGNTASATSAQAEKFTYLERLYAPEALMEEAKLIRQARLAAVICLLGIAMVVFILFANFSSTHILSFPFVYPFIFGFSQLARLGTGANGPRKKIYDEISAEIKKMEDLAKARMDRILTIYGGNKETPPLGGATVGDYITEKLRATNARVIVSGNHFPASTLRLLREAGIETLLDLRQRGSMAKLPPHTFNALNQWLREYEGNFAAEYRRLGGATGTVAPPRQTPQEAARLRDEAREFEREAARLKRERDLFPDVSGKAYFRKVLGLAETPAKSGVATP